MTRFRAVVPMCLALSSCKKAAPKYDLVGFEGEIHLAGTSSGIAATYVGPSWTIDLKIKGENIRSESTGSGGMTSAIFDAKRRKGIVLSPGRRAYSEWDAALARGKGSSKPAIVTRTGVHEKVLEYDCERMTIEEPGVGLRTDACVTKGPPLSGLGMSPLSMMTGGAGLSSALDEGIPLRVEVRTTDDNTLQVKMEATTITQKPVPDAEFAIPAGYTKD